MMEIERHLSPEAASRARFVAVSDPLA